MSRYPTLYDHLFQANCHRYFRDTLDWRWLKAQGIAASGLDPHAVSPAGARGLMQLMPATWQEITVAARLGEVSPFSPAASIQAGASFLARLSATWQQETGLARLRFAFAGYHAGLANIQNAQHLAGKRELPPNHWPSIVLTLPLVTGDNAARETCCYVRNIEKHYQELIAWPH